jgi:selenocysteine-specific elongation factor
MPIEVAQAVIGTAGHIDHGKTALIRALTGQDTDRLKEEKERGISIDLGFAYFTLLDGTRAGIIDVPGHERFIRNMLAGAHGIDLVLFTVAADDGIMPQSEEHLDILHLLGVRRGIFLITKADLVNDERLAEVREEIEILADGTCLEGAPILPVAATVGIGIEDLKTAIAHQIQGFQARRVSGLFRLPLDRAFVIKGHGTVVTGTAMGANVRLGQRLRVMPGGYEVRVRGIQVHGETVEGAHACQRVALNLSGAEKIELARGDVLVDERLDLTTSRIDTRLEVRPAARRALKQNQRVRFFLGAAEMIGRLIILNAEEIPPKASALVQIVLNEPVVALSGDRFVIRDETNSRTLGGGIVLNPLGRSSRRPLDSYMKNLSSLDREPSPVAVEAMLNLQNVLALPAMRIAHLFNVAVGDVESAFEDTRFVRLSLGDEEGYVTKGRWNDLKREAVEALAHYHRAEPLAAGLEMEAMRSRLSYEVAPRAFRAVLERVIRETEIVREDNILRLRSHRVQLSGDTGGLSSKIERVLIDAGYQPPELKQLAETLKLPSGELPRLRTILAALEREGRVVKIATDFYFGCSSLEVAKAKLIDRLSADGQITAATYRDVLGTSRKFAIALLDYFDHSGVTTRVGDTRRLRQHS